MKKNILVLGGFGFIGSNVIEALLCTNLFNIIVFEFKGVTSKFADRVKVFRGDFNSEEDLAEVFNSNKIDIVYISLLPLFPLRQMIISNTMLFQILSGPSA